jgi:8-oxo-dGTP pyrophosphatase MutT (NUDIX family)
LTTRSGGGDDKGETKPRPKTTSEYSSGGVVYRREGDDYAIAAVQRARHGDWSLPKGHIEEGETQEQAAVREVEEETGLKAKIVAPIDEVVYFYRRTGGELIRKVVYHFLMEVTGGEQGGPNWEVSEVRMVPIGEAHKLLSYKNDHEIVRKAERMLGVEKQEAASGD